MTEYRHDLSDGQKFKSETIKFGKNPLDDSIIFEGDIAGQVVFTEKGNDLIITAYGTKNDGTAVDTKTVLGKITIKDAGKKANAQSESVISYFCDGGNDSDNLLTENPVVFLGNHSSDKAQTITGTYLNEHIHGGNGNDTLKSVGGDDTIVGGKGADKMYAGEGSTGFVIGENDARVDKNGKGGDTIYNSTERDSVDIAALWGDINLKKEGNNLVIDRTIHGELGSLTDRVTIDKFWAAAKENRINFGPNAPGAAETFDEAFEDYFDDGGKILIEGKEKSANTLVGTEYNDKILGGKKADKITTGEGYDTVIAGKGDDKITIDGEGYKNIIIGKGDGKDIVSVDKEAMEDDYDVAANIEFENFDPELSKFSFAKNGNDLVITSDTKEAVTLKNFYNLVPIVLQGDFTDGVEINGYDIDDVIDWFQYKDGSAITIGSVKVSDILKNTKVGDLPIPPSIISGISPETSFEKLLNTVGIKLPSGIKNANIYIGTQHNDSFKGTTGKDVMLSFGGDNEFTTGTKGQTVIASLNVGGPSGMNYDTYKISSFEAGTAVVDMDGYYDMEINGVNTNDIHMYSASLTGYGSVLSAPTLGTPVAIASGASGIYGGSGISGGSGIYGGSGLYIEPVETTTQIDYLTDEKGISNLASINYKGIGDKILDISEKYNILRNDDDITDKKAEKLQKGIISDINSLLSTADGAIDKFRGVLVGTKKVLDEYDYRKHFDDIVVTDKKGNEHIISAESQYVMDDLTSYRLYEYARYASAKYGLFGGEGPGIAMYGPSSEPIIARFVALLAVPDMAAISKDEYDDLAKEQQAFYKKDKNDGLYKLTDKAYNEIKKDFFGNFENLYIGTDGDNKYTIKNSTMGAGIVSGTGSDSFTLSGSLINKPEFITVDDEKVQINSQEYYIASEFDQDEDGISSDKDTLTISDYSFDKKTLFAQPIELSDGEYDGVYFDGLTLNAVDYKKGGYASIGYSVNDAEDGFEITENKFKNLTIIDGSKKKFAVTAEYDEDDINYDWSSNKNNHIAAIRTDEATVVSNKGTNIISAEVYDSMKYVYGGGNDVVYSLYNSDDAYTANLDNKTSLSIGDYGLEDDDVLKITSINADKVKLFFNVELDNEAEGGYIYDTDFSFVTTNNLKKSNLLLAKHGDESEMAVDKGISVSGEIEDFYIRGEYIDVYDAMDDIAEQVANWLTTNGKYADVAEVMNSGSNKEINQILAIYNNTDLSNYAGGGIA